MHFNTLNGMCATCCAPLLQGVTATARNNDVFDDEFDYAFDGGSRVGERHVQVPSMCKHASGTMQNLNKYTCPTEF